MTTVPDSHVVQLRALEAAEAVTRMPAATADVWSVDVSRRRRRSPLTLAVVAALAGVAAMVLGGAAVIAAADSSESASARIVPASSSGGLSSVERRALALLAKPSTERVPFSGASGLVLAVGSGGRAAILVRGLIRSPVDRPYVAWIVAPGREPVRGATFTGAERAVFLTRPLGPRAAIVVSATRPASGPLPRNRIVALRR